jgi:hypothetical protein
MSEGRWCGGTGDSLRPGAKTNKIFGKGANPLECVQNVYTCLRSCTGSCRSSHQCGPSISAVFCALLGFVFDSRDLTRSR